MTKRTTAQATQASKSRRQPGGGKAAATTKPQAAKPVKRNSVKPVRQKAAMKAKTTPAENEADVLVCLGVTAVDPEVREQILKAAGEAVANALKPFGYLFEPMEVRPAGIRR